MAQSAPRQGVILTWMPTVLFFPLAYARRNGKTVMRLVEELIIWLWRDCVVTRRGLRQIVIE